MYIITDMAIMVMIILLYVLKINFSAVKIKI